MAGQYPNYTPPHWLFGILIRMTQPLFSGEGPEYYDAAYAHNRPFATPGPYQTVLAPQEEQQFQKWVSANQVPFDPTARTVDYDMRGYYRDTGGEWKGGHFPDTYKTPYDTTFSNESKYALPDTPFVWRGDNLIDTRNGGLIFGQPVRAAPAAAKQKNYFIRHADGTATPLPLVQTGPHDWETRDIVTLQPGDEIVQRI